MRMGDWSSDVCSSDLDKARGAIVPAAVIAPVISAIDAVAIAEAAHAIIAPVAIIAVGVIAAIARIGPVIVIAAPPPPVAAIPAIVIALRPPPVLPAFRIALPFAAILGPVPPFAVALPHRESGG